MENWGRTADSSVDWGVDRDMDRGVDGSMDRGMDGSMDRGVDGSMDRGVDGSMDGMNRVNGMDRAMDRCSMGRSVVRSGLSRVLDISDIARMFISHRVGYSLEATIGKSDMIFTLSGVTVTRLVGAKVGPGILVTDSIGVLVVDWGVIVMRLGGVVGGAMGGGMGRGAVDRSGRGGGGQGNQSREKKELLKLYGLVMFKDRFFLLFYLHVVS